MTGRLKLPRDVRDIPLPEQYTILGLSGGGYRGLFTAEALDRLYSKEAGRTLLDRISLYSGTSVGGLIAAGLAVGRTPSEIRDAILNHGQLIFDDRIRIFGRRLCLRKLRGPYGGLLISKYRQEPLAAAIEAVLGGDRAIEVGAVPKPLVLVATSATTRTPVIVTSLASRDSPYFKMRLSDALLATAAAPAYFPPLNSKGNALIDGGLVANAPDLVALTEAISKGRAILERCVLISIGTAKPNPASIPRKIGRRGLARWAPELFTIDRSRVFGQLSLLRAIPRH